MKWCVSVCFLFLRFIAHYFEAKPPIRNYNRSVHLMKGDQIRPKVCACNLGTFLMSANLCRFASHNKKRVALNIKL